VARHPPRRLERHLIDHVAPGPEALIFTSTTGNPVYRGTFWPSVWKPAVRAAGLDGLRMILKLVRLYVAWHSVNPHAAAASGSVFPSQLGN
jgi:hypothetical protein